MDDVRKAFEGVAIVTHGSKSVYASYFNAGYEAGRTSMQADLAASQAALEAVKRERYELASHVNELRGAIGISANTLMGYACHGDLADVLERTPQQSLEAHDRKVRNKVRRECVKSCLSQEKDNPRVETEIIAWNDSCFNCSEAINALMEDEDEV